MTLVWTTSLRMGAMALAFITGVLVARGLGPEVRGIYQVVVTVGMLGASFGGLSAELGFSQLVASHEDRPRILSTFSVASIPYGLVVGVLAAAVTALGSGGDWSVTEYLGVALLTLTSLASIWTQRVLNLLGAPAQAAALSFAGTLVTFVLVAGRMVDGALSLDFVMASAVVGALFTAVGALAFSRIVVDEVQLSTFVRGIRAGVRFHAGQCALQLLARVDVLILMAIAGSTAVGIYSVAVSITAPLAVFASTIVATFLHKQYGLEEADAVVGTLRMLALTTVLLGGLTVIAAAGAVPLVPHIWGAQFRDAGGVLLALLPGAFLLGVQRPIGNYLVRTGSARVLNARALVALVVNVVLGLWWMPSHGALGAAAASSVAYAIYAAISFVYFVRATNVSLRVYLNAHVALFTRPRHKNEE